MVEIEAPKEVLVGFAAAGVLRDDHPGYGFQDFTGAEDRTILDLLGTYRSLRAGIRNADEIIFATLNGDRGLDRPHGEGNA